MTRECQATPGPVSSRFAEQRIGRELIAPRQIYDLFTRREIAFQIRSRPSAQVPVAGRGDSDPAPHDLLPPPSAHGFEPSEIGKEGSRQDPPCQTGHLPRARNYRAVPGEAMELVLDTAQTAFGAFFRDVLLAPGL